MIQINLIVKVGISKFCVNKSLYHRLVFTILKAEKEAVLIMTSPSKTKQFHIRDALPCISMQ